MGHSRDLEVHRRVRDGVKFDCPSLQLDRVHGNPGCRYVSVSSSRIFRSTSLRRYIPRYGMQYHGQMALFTSILVAFTQIIPEHQVQIFGFFRARVKVAIFRSLKDLD